VSPARGLCGGRARGRMIAGLRVDGGVGSHGGLCARYVLYPSVR
jgi:hypothetical protein